MSKQLKMGVKVQNANENTLQNTLKRMKNDVGLQIINCKDFPIWNGKMVKVQGTCIKLPDVSRCVDVYVKDGQLVLNGDEMDLDYVRQKLVMFYGATYAESQLTNVQSEYNKKADEIDMYVSY